MKIKNYVVMLKAPVNVRVRAASKADAIRRACAIMSAREEVTLKRDEDFDDAWLDSSPWEQDAADVTDGGVFLSNAQTDTAETINPPHKAAP